MFRFYNEFQNIQYRFAVTEIEYDAPLELCLS